MNNARPSNSKKGLPRRLLLILLAFITTLIIAELSSTSEMPRLLAGWISTIEWAEGRAVLVVFHFAFILWLAREAVVSNPTELVAQFGGAFIHFALLGQIAKQGDSAAHAVGKDAPLWYVVFVAGFFLLVLSAFYLFKYESTKEQVSIVRFIITHGAVLIGEALVVGILTLILVRVIRVYLSVDQSFFVVFPPTSLAILSLQILSVENQYVPNLRITEYSPKLMYFVLCTIYNGLWAIKLINVAWLTALGSLPETTIAPLVFLIGAVYSVTYFGAAIISRRWLSTTESDTWRFSFSAFGKYGLIFGLSGCFSGAYIAAIWFASPSTKEKVGAFILTHTLAGIVFGACYYAFMKTTAIYRTKWGL